MESFLLRERLERAGFAPAVFRYPSTQAALAAVVTALAAKIRSLGDTVHLVGHSLGGLVVLETLERAGGLPQGRVVLLGSPVRGSRAASAVAAWSFGPQLLGPLAVAELARPRARQWRQSRQIGLIAGTRSIGIGQWLADLPSPNDGTVAVEETRLPGATAHRMHDVSHTGMLFSEAVAAATARFLDNGHF